MPPTIALFLWFFLLVALLCFYLARERKTSWALWVPVLWMFFAASRLPSQWLEVQAGVVAEAMEEGNPLDRTIYFALILLAIVILVVRSFNWSDFLTRNSALTLFLLYALVSMVWSDFPFIAFKRWFRDLGNYFVVLVGVLIHVQRWRCARYFAASFIYRQHLFQSCSLSTFRNCPCTMHFGRVEPSMWV